MIMRQQEMVGKAEFNPNLLEGTTRDYNFRIKPEV